MSIIRTEQNWLPKSIDAGLTLAAWAGFLYLITNGAVPFIEQLIVHPEQFQSVLYRAFMPLIEQLADFLAWGALLGAVLLIWAKYNELRASRYSRRQNIPNLCDKRICASFFVTLADLKILRYKQILILHNTEHGDLSWIEDPAVVRPRVHSLRNGAALQSV
ncbi:poly-beta-1,6-N-acetyl-D-glucosamine biosynthesis protein PgaD [Pseudomonas sp. NPDC078700]|uniref:poly-beta-1,6-N-acetyl-D-glucosamine biosynthesis protein PgaD n=1 Tax=Pseudomonas sp. NPDC078700 TaxID=3364424 RepID=UPI0037C917D6